jgi:ribosomal protein S18 acetylase RimI-like enzyme
MEPTAEPRDLIRLDLTHRDRAVDVLVRAFADEPGYSWVFPDANERSKALRRYFDAFLALNLAYGEVDATRDFGGVACWLPPLRGFAAFWAALRSGFGTTRAMLGFSRDAQARMIAMVRYSERVAKSAVPDPHWTLGLLGVDPARQRQGIGSALLAAGLARADAEGRVCYLETERESSARLYERHGFVVVNEGKIPGHDQCVWTMVRQPRVRA